METYGISISKDGVLWFEAVVGIEDKSQAVELLDELSHKLLGGDWKRMLLYSQQFNATTILKTIDTQV